MRPKPSISGAGAGACGEGGVVGRHAAAKHRGDRALGDRGGLRNGLRGGGAGRRLGLAVRRRQAAGGLGRGRPAGRRAGRRLRRAGAQRDRGDRRRRRAPWPPPRRRLRPAATAAIVHAADHAEGMGASLRAGIASLPPDAAGAFVFLGDMPRVPPRVLQPLADAVAGGRAGRRAGLPGPPRQSGAARPRPVPAAAARSPATPARAACCRAWATGWPWSRAPTTGCCSTWIRPATCLRPERRPATAPGRRRGSGGRRCSRAPPRWPRSSGRRSGRRPRRRSAPRPRAISRPASSRTTTASPLSKRPSTRAHAGRQQALAAPQRRGRAGVDHQRALRAPASRRSRPCRRRPACVDGSIRVARSPSSTACSGDGRGGRA